MNSRLARSVAAATLVVPLAVVGVAAPAVASTTLLTDHYAPYPVWGYGYALPPSAGTRSQTSSTLDTSVATDTQTTGLVTVSSTVSGGTAAGTGIVLDADGLVVTNHHVVEGATSVTVTVVATGATYVADVLGTSASKDVAVLQLEDADGLTPVTTSAGTLAEGDDVTAVGDAGGDGGTLSAAPGTVTDLHHAIRVTDEQTGEQTPLRNLVEVSSDIISGDSGGALLDADGDVVGMNVAASSGSADVTGYVIPIGRVLKVVDTVLAGESTSSVAVGESAHTGAFLGVGLSAGLSAGAGAGASIAGVVEGSPAESLGLAAGDVVTALDGTAVDSAEALSAAIAEHAVGEQVSVTWTDTTGATRTGTTTLAAGPVA